MPQPAKRSPSLAARLTRKAGPLPVWAWAAVILGAYFLYTRLSSSGSSSASTDTTAVTSTDSTGDSGAQVPASGGGSAADNVSGDLLDGLNANTASLDALTSQILSQPTPYSNFGDGPLAGAPAEDTGQGSGPAASPSPAPAPTTPAAVPAGHPTQTAAGVLRWGGLTFTTRAAFDSWAKAHGSSTAKELSNHPQAKAIYSTLK